MCLNEKKVKDKELVRDKRKEFRGLIRKAKLAYKDKIENRLYTGNAKKAWEGLNSVMGREKKKQVCSLQGAHFVEYLNVFFTRFDKGDCTTECERICFNIPAYEPITLKEYEIAASLASIKPNKAPGSDRQKGHVLKDCAFQLTSVLTGLFQLLLKCWVVPNSWKEAKIVLVPKISNANELKYFRPIALTSILGKCRERVLTRYIWNNAVKDLDPLQFAYRGKRGSDDAVITLCDLVAEHIQTTTNYVRILLIDFSSAFNSIRIDILLQRLINLGVNGDPIWWIKDFLVHRPQKLVKLACESQLTEILFKLLIIIILLRLNLQFYLLLEL